MTVTSVYKNNAHIQFRFSQGYRFLLWDQSNDGVFGAGYLATGIPQKSDKTDGAVLFDANQQLTLDWMVIVNEGKAYWFINGALMATFEQPALEYFNIGAQQTNLVVYDVDLTVKEEKTEKYAAIIEEYRPVITPITDPNAVYINNAGLSTNPNITTSGKTYTTSGGSELTGDYVIKGSMLISAVNKNNAHIQFRFSGDYRFLLWDSDNDGKFGVGYTIPDSSKNDKTPGAVLIDANKPIILEWAVIVKSNMAYLYINGECVETMTSPTLSYFNIGAIQTNIAIYGVECTVASENATGYSALLTEYGIS